MDASPNAARWLAVVAVQVLRRPSLWATALRQVHRLARPGWLRAAPHLPVPASEYLAFRLETQYGDAERLDPRDAITYLRWCRSFQALR